MGTIVFSKAFEKLKQEYFIDGDSIVFDEAYRYYDSKSDPISDIRKYMMGGRHIGKSHVHLGMSPLSYGDAGHSRQQVPLKLTEGLLGGGYSVNHDPTSNVWTVRNTSGKVIRTMTDAEIMYHQDDGYTHSVPLHDHSNDGYYKKEEEMRADTIGSYGYALNQLAGGLQTAAENGFLTEEEAKEEFRSHVALIQNRKYNEAEADRLEKQMNERDDAEREQIAQLRSHLNVNTQ